MEKVEITKNLSKLIRLQISNQYKVEFSEVKIKELSRLRIKEVHGIGTVEFVYVSMNGQEY